jgi:hypothetical protein
MGVGVHLYVNHRETSNFVRRDSPLINFERIDRNISKLRTEFENNKPFRYLAIDDLCDPERLNRLVDKIPDPIEVGIKQSRDYVFAKNKFEKSRFRDLDPLFDEIYMDLTSERFKQFLQEITGEEVFLDSQFHGGGLHQGGADSFLDMHADFNYHPLHKEWFRDLNILLYLNRGWESSYGGQLKLRHLHHPERGTGLVEPLFNRCVIMPTRDYTLHGYDKINFPQGTYRRSLAAYAYRLTDLPVSSEVRSTRWYPENSGFAKKALGQSWPRLVKMKSAIFGSRTAKNA